MLKHLKNSNQKISQIWILKFELKSFKNILDIGLKEDCYFILNFFTRGQSFTEPRLVKLQPKISKLRDGAVNFSLFKAGILLSFYCQKLAEFC